MNLDFRRRCKAIMTKTMEETKDEKKHTYRHKPKNQGVRDEK